MLALSKDGAIQNRFNTKELGIHEPLADITETDGGDLYIGLERSQEIWHVSREGKLKELFPRKPSPFVTDARVFGLSRDPSKDVLYLTDTVHHTLEIWDHEKRLTKTLRLPVTANPNSKYAGAQPFTYPLGMDFYENRLYVADTDNHRLVVLFPDGVFDRAFDAVSEGTGRYIYPRRVSRNKNKIYFVNLGPRLNGGQVVMLDINTEQHDLVYEPFPMDPVDVLARADDLLVVDSKSKSVHRFTLGGEYIGLFGSQELQRFYTGSEIQQKTFKWMRFVSLGAVIIILLKLIALNRRQKSYHLKESPAPLIESLRGMSQGRRRFLIGAVPGLGYLASSRYIEFFGVVISALFVVIAVYIEFIAGERHSTVFGVNSYAATTMLLGLIATVWTLTTVHALSLVENALNQAKGGAKHLLLKFIGTAVIAALAVIAGQGLGEIILSSAPSLSQLGSEMGIVMSSLFDVLTGENPANVGYKARLFPTDNIFRQALAYGLGVGIIFSALTHFEERSKDKIIRNALVGIIAGVLVWIANIGLFGNVLGSGFILIITLGFSVGIVMYAFFRKTLSLICIVASMAGTWLGSAIYLMLLGAGYELYGSGQLAGFIFRSGKNASAFFVMTIFILLVQHALTKNKMDSE